jgi:hypothetical protein
MIEEGKPVRPIAQAPCPSIRREGFASGPGVAALHKKAHVPEEIGLGGNISRTAKFVGRAHAALHRKIKMLGIAQQPLPIQLAAAAKARASPT